MGSSTADHRVGGALGGVLADATAFRAWYDLVLPRVYGYLYQRCGRDRDLAEELTQQTFVDAVRSHGRTTTDDPVRWVIGIARHKLADHFRALERRERGYLRLVARSPEPAVTWLGDHDAEGVLVDALRRLPAAQRAAVTLRYVDDLPVREVAALLGRSDGAVESLLSRGRETLRRAPGVER
jgi:RNA polymerase sigma-70 factor (ECF subfamily)